MKFPVPIDLISAILGHYGPIYHVSANWPLVEAALEKRRVYTPFSAIAAIATIAIETMDFNPHRERGGPTYLTHLYENRKDLGNVHPGDGVKFCGRGFIQITGRKLYAHVGSEIGRNLEKNPDLVLKPAIAADVLALYFHERMIHVHADQQNWEMVRLRIKRHPTDVKSFTEIVTKLVSALAKMPGDYRVEMWRSFIR